MSKFEVELNTKAVGELLKSQEITDFMLDIARQMKGQTGEGYSTDSFVGRTRSNVSIYPATKEAQKDNYQNNTLIKVSRSFKQ